MATTTERIGSYTVEGELGRGAFGVVYRAHHVRQPDAPVALKVVENRGNLDRLMLEPALLSELRHPCIVRLDDYFLDADRLVLALELIRGEDLKTSVDRGETFTQEEVRELLVQMGGALAEAHAHNVVHRDIKLSNIMVDRSSGRPRFVLTDFGVGRTAEGIQAEKHTGGTYLFMAPEQLRGRPGPQSDLWALGVVAYRLLTGRMPFSGTNLHELSSQIFYATPTPPSKCTARPIDGDLESVVFHLLEKSLTDRTASAEELLRELGYRGESTAVASGPALRPTGPAAGTAQDRRIQRRIAWLRGLLIVFVMIYMFQKGLLAGGLLTAGLLLFYFGHRREQWGLGRQALAVAASVALLAASSILPFFPAWDITVARVAEWTALAGASNHLNQKAVTPSPAVDATLNAPGTVVAPDESEMLFAFLAVLMVIAAILLLIALFFVPPLAALCFSALRRQQRLQALRRAVQDSSGDPELYLNTMKAFLDTRFEDVAFHLKYAEALLTRGRLKEVAVEAKILLLQDPYNFSGNLLLANAYAALGLLDDCVAVCNAYLSVAGYCFEFGELKQQCLRRKGATA